VPPAGRDEAPGLSGPGITGDRLRAADRDLRPHDAGLTQAVLHCRGQRGLVQAGIGDHGDVGAPRGLADLVFTHLPGSQQRRGQRERMHGGGPVAEDVVGASLDAGAQEAAHARHGRGKPVGELVTDQRLGEVVQVGDQHAGGRRAVGDRAAGLVDALGDAGVTGEGQHQAAGIAVADQPLRRDERIDHRDAERAADGLAIFRDEHLGDRGDSSQPQPQPSRALLSGQFGQLGRVPEQGGRLSRVEALDDPGGGQGRRGGNQPQRRAGGRGRGHTAGMHRRCRGHEPDHEPVGQLAAARQERGHRPAHE
jgi:hypothetical protein